MLKKIRENGWAYSFAIAFNRIVPARLLRYRRFIVYQMKPAGNARPNEHVEMSWCKSKDDFTETARVTYYDRRSDSEMAVRAKYDGTTAGGMWAAVDRFVEDDLGVAVILDEQQTWLFAARVDSEFRRKGVFMQVLNCLRSELANRGLTHQLVSVNPHNIGSSKVHANAAFYVPGYVRAIRVYKTTFCLTRGDVSCDRFVSWNSDKSPIQLRIPSKELPG